MKKLPLLIFTSLLGIIPFTYADNATSGVTTPSKMTFHNDDQLSIQLSSEYPSKISVEGDQLADINCPNSACSVSYNKNDLTGSAYIKVLSIDNFPIFLRTHSGRQFSLMVTPLNEPSKTIIFKPLDGAPINASFEKNTDYETLLVNLDKAAMNGESPDGYGLNDVSQMKAFTMKNGLMLQPIEALVGDAMSVIKFSVKNPTSTIKVLNEQDFYRTGVRAISIDHQTLQTGETGFIYEIISQGGENNE